MRETVADNGRPTAAGPTTGDKPVTADGPLTTDVQVTADWPATADWPRQTHVAQSEFLRDRTTRPPWLYLK